MLAPVLALLFFGGASFLLGLAARSDWREMHIANRISEALAGLFVLGVLIPDHFFDGVRLISGLIAGVLVLALTLFLYAMRAMGGGDTKLATATALLVGVHNLGIFLITMALTGGLLAAYALLVRKQPNFLPAKLTETSPPHAWLSQLKNGAGKVPYGIAIAVGGIVALALKWVAPLLS